MNVRPMLGDWEIPRIQHIESLERRMLAELPVPGRVGSLFQDMSAAPMRIAISGSLYGDEARGSFFEDLREKFQAGEPVTFVGDIVTATEVQYVVIETLELCESGMAPDQTDYRMVLRESPPPPPPPDPLGGLDTELLGDIDGLMDSALGALDLIDSIGSVPDVSDPTPPLTSALDGVVSATSGLEDTLAPLRDIFGSDC
jgi:hypothetical protein